MSKSKKILIIDDEPDARAFLKAVLEDEGYETMVASNGEEGLKVARETLPNMITLDLMMPNKSGVGFLNAARADEKLKEIPIVVCSGARYATGVDMKQYLESQPFGDRKKGNTEPVDITPDGYLEKPIKPAELLELVKKLT
ncbi:response regulator [Acidobacteriota bacterium]